MLHGTNRSTADVDVVVEMPANDIKDLKRRIANADPMNFEAIGFNLWHRSPRIIIELLTPATFTWPSPLTAGSVLVSANGINIAVLRPLAIVICKSSRLCNILGGDRPPKTVKKRESDLADITALCPLISDADLATVISLYTAIQLEKIRKSLLAVAPLSPVIADLVERIRVVAGWAVS